MSRAEERTHNIVSGPCRDLKPKDVGNNPAFRKHPVPAVTPDKGAGFLRSVPK